MISDLPIRPAHVHEPFVLAKCDYFVDVQLWPRRTNLDPKAWLNNFRDDEREYAVHLLNAFLYFSTDFVNELFRAAFQRLSCDVASRDEPFVQAQARWQQFRRNVLVTFVMGETPSETDSGLSFARKARQELGVPEENIMAPERALQVLIDNGPRPVVFVDDFVGSGDQCVATWRREYELADGNLASFQQFSTVRGTNFFYCPVLCADMGRQVIE